MGEVPQMLAQEQSGAVCLQHRVFPQPLRPNDLQIGVYDPGGAFRDASGINIEHVFVPWVDVDLNSFGMTDVYADQRKRKLLVTLEPWSWSLDQNGGPEELRDNILNGSYDATISQACEEIGKFKSPVTIRWGHEMDLKNGRYPWSDWSPQDFIDAYRHFVDICRQAAPKAAFMWSPRGERVLQSFYPGNDYVDSIGLSVFGLQSYDEISLGENRNFTTLFKPSYDRATRFGKPIYISEFGCSGDDAYVAGCNDLSVTTLTPFPLLKGVIYYSAVETGEWPVVFERPDWRVYPQTERNSSAQACSR
ncbi:MAG: beta-mannosidase [Rhizobiaceae bacterium]|nr:beta-mannosidase [Rhizobiaceae bacterium]